MANSAQAALNESVWRKGVDFLLRRRVRITVAVFVLLVVEDVLTRVQPHDLVNLRDYRVVLGLGLVFGGLALRSWAAGTLRKRKLLVMSGPYQLVRHPLYVGSYLMMLGFCLLVDDWENIVVVLGPILLLYVLRILSEEKHLAEIFPDQWPEFTQKVPRFIPRHWPKNVLADWSFAQWLKNREYQALGAALLGLAAIQTWHIAM